MSKGLKYENPVNALMSGLQKDAEASRGVVNRGSVKDVAKSIRVAQHLIRTEWMIEQQASVLPNDYRTTNYWLGISNALDRMDIELEKLFDKTEEELEQEENGETE